MILDIFETHLTVRRLENAVEFYRDVLGLELASVFPQRRVAFFWAGGRGHSMLGLWEAGSMPLQMVGHTAFAVRVEDVLAAPQRLREAGITPLDLDGATATEPVVLAWMPAVSIYFKDPDGNLLEYISMLPETPRPELGVVAWSQWLIARSG